MRDGARFTRTGLVAAAIAAGACNGSERPAAGVVVRDSAGIRIVESATPLIAPGSWTVSSVPAVEIGANERDSMQILHDVAGAVRLSDGRIVIAHGVAPALRWFDSTGAFTHGTGRFGQGPGEFDGGEGAIWIYSLWALPGDSIATWEHSRRRLQLFDSQGRYVRALMTELPPNMPAQSYPQIAGRVDGGFIFFLHDEEAMGPLGTTRLDSADLLRYDDAGRYARSIARVPTFLTYFREMRSRAGRTMPVATRLPFSPPWSFAVDRDRFYQGGRARYEIAAHDTAGAIRLLIRRPGPLRPLTTAVVDDYKAQLLAAAGDDPNRRRDIEDRLDPSKLPDSLPAYRALRVDREGMLWVRLYDPAGTSPMWSVHDRDGRWVTDVAIPTALSIQEIGRDYILAVVPDDVGVERVRLYRLTGR